MIRNNRLWWPVCEERQMKDGLWSRLMAPFMVGRYPQKSNDPLRFGCELETILMRRSAPAEASGALEVCTELAKLSGTVPTLDHGHVVAVQHNDWPAVVTMDAGRNVTEFIYKPTTSLHGFETQTRLMMDIAVAVAADLGYAYVGTGVHPLLAVNPETWNPRPRYAALQRYLVQGGHETTRTASTQVTVDARHPAHLLAMLNVGNGLAGPIAALFANSGITTGSIHEDGLASRVRTWQRICREQRRVGIPYGVETTPGKTRRFRGLDEYLRYLFSLNYALHRLPDGMIEVVDQPFMTAVNTYGRTDDELANMIQFMVGSTWFDARWRTYNNHAVEFRVPCRQRQGEDEMACIAFLVGLAENAIEIQDTIIDHKRWGFWRDFRKPCTRFGLKTKHDGVQVKDVLMAVLELVRNGLERRGLGEEDYLEPLYRRLESGITPAEEAFLRWGNGGVDAFIEWAGYRTSKPALRLVEQSRA